MKFRFGGKTGSEVPPLEQSLEGLQADLAQQQKQWAEQLARDPGSFGQLEPQIHLVFQQLADRCAASLLAHSSAQPACADAAKKKVDQADRPLRSPEKRPRCVRLLGGLVLWVSTLYCAPSSRSGKPRRDHGGGLHPELAVFGFHHGQSAALASLVARQSTLMPSFELARQELGRRGLKLNVKVVQGSTHRLGEQLLIARCSDLELYRNGKMPAGTEFVGKRIVVQLDGGRIRLRKVTRKQKGRGKAKKQKRRYKGHWREPKLLTIYEIDRSGQKVRKSRARIDGSFQGPDEMMELLAMHLHRLGAAQAEVVVFVSDGAPWIWERLPWVVKRVGLDSKKVAYALDWCHALHHVGLALAAVALPEDEHRRVFKKLRKWLKKGETATVLNELERLGEQHGVLEAMATPVAYLDRHLKAGHLEYDSLRSRGLPIGSGAIESAIRRVINLRLKGNGMMWYEGNAEGMLLLRAAALTGRWEEALDRALQSKWQDGRIKWSWSSPDMPFQLKTNAEISPPVPQVQSVPEDRRIPA
jgi:hypothetical protein